MIQLSQPVAMTLRPFLIAQGAPPDVVDPNNQLDPALLFSTFYDTVLVESNVLPPLSIATSAAGGPSGPLLGLLGLRFTLSGRAGTQRLAPRGGPIPGLGWVFPLVFVGTLFAIGYAVGKRAR